MFDTYNPDFVQIFDAVRKSPKYRKYYENTLLMDDGRTVGMLDSQIKDMIKGLLIVQQLIIPEQGEPYLLLQTTDNFIANRYHFVCDQTRGEN